MIYSYGVSIILYLLLYYGKDYIFMKLSWNENIPNNTENTNAWCVKSLGQASTKRRKRSLIMLLEFESQVSPLEACRLRCPKQQRRPKSPKVVLRRTKKKESFETIFSRCRRGGCWWYVRCAVFKVHYTHHSFWWVQHCVYRHRSVVRTLLIIVDITFPRNTSVPLT